MTLDELIAEDKDTPIDGWLYRQLFEISVDELSAFILARTGHQYDSDTHKISFVNTAYLLIKSERTPIYEA